MGLTEILKSKPVETFTTLITIIMAIISMTKAIQAYNQLNSATSDFNGITVNWATPPLQAVQVVGNSCPVGFSPIGPNMTFPGLEQGPCACYAKSSQSTTNKQVSTTTACNTNQTDAGCYQVGSLSSVDLSLFLGKTLCYARGGEASVLSYSPFTARPYPDSSGNCPTDFNGVAYKKCGTNTYTDSNFPICWPTSESCPLVYMEGASSAPTEGSLGGAYGSASETTMNFVDPLPAAAEAGAMSNGNELYQINGSLLTSNSKTFPPIVDLQTAFASSGPCYDVNTPQDDYNTAKATWDNLVSISSAPTNPLSLSDTQPGSCDTGDTRYVKFATSTQSTLLEQNFESLCPTLATGTYDPYANTCSFGSSGCCDESASGSTKCLYPNLKNNCESGDKICEKIQYLSECGKYQMLVNAAPSQEISMYFRTQIEWKASCSVGKNQVENVVEPLDKTTSAQLGLVVINVIAGILVGILIPCLIIYNIWYDDVPCVSGKGAEEKKRLKWYSSHITLVLNIIKMIPLIITIVLITNLTGIFDDLASQDCSDSLTNETFIFLATTLPAVRSANMTTLGSDIVSLLLAIMEFVKHKCCGDDEEKDENAEQNPVVKVELENRANAL